ASDEEPVDAQMAQEMAARLRRFYVGQGFLRARVLEREIAGRDTGVELVFSIDEDEPVRVEELVFAGNREIPTAQLRERVLQQLRDGIVSDPADDAAVALRGHASTRAGERAGRTAPRTAETSRGRSRPGVGYEETADSDAAGRRRCSRAGGLYRPPPGVGGTTEEHRPSL